MTTKDNVYEPELIKKNSKYAKHTCLRIPGSKFSILGTCPKHLQMSALQESPPEKALVTHSSTLAWEIPWTEEPGRLQFMGSWSRTRLSDFTFTFHFHALEKVMATHSSVFAWRLPRTGEPGGLPSMGLHRVGQD